MARQTVRRWSKAILLGLCFSLATIGHAAAPSPVMLSIACGGCHGTLGDSAGPSMPNLAGQSRDYLISSMQRFRSGERPGTIMGRLAKGYSDADIEAMADFFSGLKPAPQTAATDPELVKKGALVFYNQCRYCHLDKGKLWARIHQGREYDRQCRHCHADYGSDNADVTPNIAGQWPAYLQIQLDDFARGARRMSKRKAEKLRALSRADMEAVAQFYASQTDKDK